MLTYGIVSKEGEHFTTLTRPDLFADYYTKMLGAVMSNHQVPVKIGVSDWPIPIRYAFADGLPKDVTLDDAAAQKFEACFDPINLEYVDDRVVNKSIIAGDQGRTPLAFFTAPRVDYSLQRLSYYTGTDPKYFQKFVLFTNYQFYVEEFRRVARNLMKKTDAAMDGGGEDSLYTSFVEPGNRIFYNQNTSDVIEAGKSAPRILQMPAYHLTREDGNGITLVNIGVGPSNARNITDHISVLRPHAWIMVGHCGALRKEMNLGDYVLAHGYAREDRILDNEVKLSNPIVNLAEIQVALQQAVREVTKREDQDVVRTGTVVTVLNRNWELDGKKKIDADLEQNHAIAVDMESGTVAANGYRYRVPYGTFLVVSDNPVHGAPKTSGAEEKLYLERIDQHIKIGIKTCERLRKNPDKLHSRKLSSAFEPAFL